jgi:hypothetical protein
MYVALFLFPWMLMYGLSTLAMNHRDWFIQRYGRGPVPFEVERELVYDGTFPQGADAGLISRQILASLGMDGAHRGRLREDGAIVIDRHDLLSPRRLTYTPASGVVVIERMQPRANAFFERFHRRRGYETGYALDTAWAVTVDLVIAAMIFWALSGLWMWWELKATRRTGAVAFSSGVVLFALYLLTL